MSYMGYAGGEISRRNFIEFADRRNAPTFRPISAPDLRHRSMMLRVIIDIRWRREKNIPSVSVITVDIRPNPDGGLPRPACVRRRMHAMPPGERETAPGHFPQGDGHEGRSFLKVPDMMILSGAYHAALLPQPAGHGPGPWLPRQCTGSLHSVTGSMCVCRHQRWGVRSPVQGVRRQTYLDAVVPAIAPSIARRNASCDCAPENA